jgi:predicted PurR-regulated permease PerM
MAGDSSADSELTNENPAIVEASAEKTGPGATEVEVRIASGLRPWLSLFAVALILWLLISYGRLLAEVLAVGFGAYLLHLAMRPLANRLAKRRIPAGVTVILLYLAAASVIALMVHFTAPTILQEFARARNTVPLVLAEAQERLNIVPILGDVNLTPATLADNTEEQLPTLATLAVGVAGDLLHVAIDLTLVLVLAYIFVTDRRLGPDLLFTWVPRPKRWRVRTIFVNTSRRLTRWLAAQIVIAAFFGILFGLGLWLLGLPFAATIAVIGGLLEFVPFLGGAVSLVLSSLVALAFEPGLVPWVVILYFLVNLIQTQILQPFLYSRAVEAHPAAILIALLIGAQAGGVLGALFAVPAAVVALTLLDEIEKPGEAPPEETDHSLARRLPGEVGSTPEAVTSK